MGRPGSGGAAGLAFPTGGRLLHPRRPRPAGVRQSSAGRGPHSAGGPSRLICTVMLVAQATPAPFCKPRLFVRLSKVV